MTASNDRDRKTSAFSPPAQFSFLRIPTVLKRRGLSRSSHYSDIKVGLYPKPVSIGVRAVAHPDYEVDALNAAANTGMSSDEIRTLVLKLESARAAALPE
jgi:prophage regulatory protein